MSAGKIITFRAEGETDPSKEHRRPSVINLAATPPQNVRIIAFRPAFENEIFAKNLSQITCNHISFGIRMPYYHQVLVDPQDLLYDQNFTASPSQIVALPPKDCGIKKRLLTPHQINENPR